MIDLTPLDVRKKKGDFRRAMRGYEPALVDDFLDLAADRLEELVRETRAQGEELVRLREQVAEFREREKALTEALVTAQEMRQAVRGTAEREAELVRREAEAQAQRRLREAEAEAEQIRAGAAEAAEQQEDALRRLRARRANVMRSFRAYLERELRELEVMQDSLDDEETPAVAAPHRPARPAGAVPLEPAPRAEHPRLLEDEEPGAAGPGAVPPAEDAAAPAAGREEERSAAARDKNRPAADLEDEDLEEDNYRWLSSLLKEEP